MLLRQAARAALRRIRGMPTTKERGAPLTLARHRLVIMPSGWRSPLLCGTLRARVALAAIATIWQNTSTDAATRRAATSAVVG